MNKEIKTIADHFGPVTQLAKQAEEGREVAEATESFHHSLILENDPEEIERKRKSMIEEMADVWIMVRQNIYHHSSPEEFQAFVEAKIKRTLKRIKNGYYE